ncbi:hypothetical protein Tco_0995972 [Tanacetum coccineum]
MLRVFPFTLTGFAKRRIDRLALRTINTWDLLKKAFIQRYCPPSMTAKQLKDIYNFKQEGDESLYQAWERYNDLLYKCPTHDINSHQKTMADHSKKWHDGTTSRNIGSSSSNNELAALDCPLNEEVKQVEKIRYGEFGRTTPFNGNNKGKFRVGTPGYYTKTDNHPTYGEKRQSLKELLAKHQEESARRSTEMEVWIKKLQENAEINTRNQSASLKNLETQIEQLTEELRSRKEKSEQAKVVIVEHEGPSSPKKLKNLHRISFLSDSQEENTNDQLPTKESNPGHFTLPCTIRNFNFYSMADLGASVNVLPRNIFEYLELTNLSETKMLVEDSVWSKRYSEWCNENSYDKKPRPRDYTFKEWVKLKKGHLDINKSIRKDLFRSWVIDQFTEALDLDKNPLERWLDEYNWVFHKEIEQRANENEIKIGEKGQVLEEIWTKCNEDYDPPKVHTKTFEVTKYKFNNRCSFICVSGENNETMSLGRKNGSRFKKIIMEEIEEVLGNDWEDSDNEM